MNEPANGDKDDRLPTPGLDENTLHDNESSDGVGRIERSYRSVGPYQIIEKIGEGGMGVVFLAKQEKPIARNVALKVIKTQANSSKVVARFEAERQALAMMDHPNIARILDAGTTKDGLPYFAMEVVNGLPIQRYCDQQRLSIEERLRLFIPVCQAVQHAHQKGIIHRDLKPSNVLVEHNDGKPIPKVIDFGLAKAVDQSNLLHEHSQQTDFGKIVGTVQYMSPEQAETGATDLDTRTDVYSLGVILYELLTGCIPLDAETLAEHALFKVLEIIRDHEPPRPSHRLAESSDTISSVSEQRRIGPRQLESMLKGDLDWIVMKAIDKERHRRYESASSFAADIGRFLDSKVVYARPPSTAYRFQKFVRRNRLVVVTASVAGLLLLSGALGTSWFAYKANIAAAEEEKQKKIAVLKSQEAKQQNERANRLKKIAQQSAERSTAVLKIVTDSFGSSDPNRGAKAGMTAVDVLKNAKELMSGSTLDGQGKGKLLSTLTKSFIGVGAVDLAVSTAQESLTANREHFGRNSVPAMRALNNLAVAQHDAGELKRAEELYQECLKLRIDNLGPEHIDTLGTRNNLANTLYEQGRYKEAHREFQKLYDLRRKTLGENHSDTYRSKNNLSIVLQRLGSYREASKLLVEVVDYRNTKLGSDHPETISATANLAGSFFRGGEIRKAEGTYRQVLEIARIKLGQEHPTTIGITINLANVLRKAGKLDDALKVIKRAYLASQSKFGDDHPYTLSALQNVAVITSGLGKIDDAIQYNEKLRLALEKKYGVGNPRTLGTIFNLALEYNKTGRFKKSLKMLQDVVPKAIASSGNDNIMVMNLRAKLGSALIRNGQTNAGVKRLQEVQVARKDKLGSKHPDYLSGQHDLAVAYQELDEYTKALDISLSTYEILSTLDWAVDHPLKLANESQLAGLYEQRKDFEKSEVFHVTVVDGRARKLGENHPSTLESILDYSKFLLNRRRYAEAKQQLETYLTESGKSGTESWKTSYAKSLLGEALLRLEKLEQAEEFLVDGYLRMKARKESIAPMSLGNKLEIVVSRLIELARKRNNSEQLEKWESELTQIKGEGRDNDE